MRRRRVVNPLMRRLPDSWIGHSRSSCSFSRGGLPNRVPLSGIDNDEQRGAEDLIGLRVIVARPARERAQPIRF